MFLKMTETVKSAHKEGTVHSEFWKFVGYATATFVVIRQSSQPISWPYVLELVSFLAIVAASSTAIKVLSIMKRGSSDAQQT